MESRKHAYPRHLHARTQQRGVGNGNCPAARAPAPDYPNLRLTMTRSSILSLLLLALGAAACGARDSSEPATETADIVVPAAAESGSYGVDASAGAASPSASPPAASAARTQAAPTTTTPEIAAADTAAFAPEEPGTVPGVAAVSLNPMLVRTGQAVLRVDSLEAGTSRVRALARRVGATVGNTTITAGTDEARRAQMELRIPSLNFDDAVSGLAPIGRVESVNVTAEDVGEEYTDVSARVANARRLEGRLLALLETRSGRLEEVLNLEREVARVRGEIEGMEGRMRYLRSRSSVSILTITLHEGETAIGRDPGERPIRDAFATAWRSFVDLLAGLIASLGVVIPLGFLGYLAWRGYRTVRRREDARDAAYREALRRERERTPAPAPEPEEPALRP